MSSLFKHIKSISKATGAILGVVNGAVMGPVAGIKSCYDVTLYLHKYQKNLGIHKSLIALTMAFYGPAIFISNVICAPMKGFINGAEGIKSAFKIPELTFMSPKDRAPAWGNDSEPNLYKKLNCRR